jgi:hypothetical protein
MMLQRQPLPGATVKDGRIVLHLAALHRSGEIIDCGECAFLARGEPDQVHGLGRCFDVELG